MNILHALVCLCVPALANWSANRFKWAKTLGPVVLSYAAGIVFGNLPGVHLDGAFGQSIALEVIDGRYFARRTRSRAAHRRRS